MRKPVLERGRDRNSEIRTTFEYRASSTGNPQVFQHGKSSLMESLVFRSDNCHSRTALVLVGRSWFGCRTDDCRRSCSYCIYRQQQAAQHRQTRTCFHRNFHCNSNYFHPYEGMKCPVPASVPALIFSLSFAALRSIR